MKRRTPAILRSEIESNNTMLTTLNLGNFKAFAETQKIPIRPLTLIFGANSAGKSSILHGLLFAREALESGRLDVSQTGLAGSSVDLGGFDQFIHRHNNESSFAWGADFQLPLESSLFGLKTSDSQKLSMQVDIAKAPFGVIPHKINLSVFGQPLLRLGFRSPVIQTNQPLFCQKGIRQAGGVEFWGTGFRFLIEHIELKNPIIETHIVPAVETYIQRQISKAERAKIGGVIDELSTEITAMVEKFFPAMAEIVYPEDFFGKSFRQNYPALINWMEQGQAWEKLKSKSPGVAGKLAKKDFVGIVGAILFSTLDEVFRKLHGCLSMELSRFTYLGPLRSYPDRHYAFGERKSDRFASGDHAWDVLCGQEAVRANVNEWLKRMDIRYEIGVRLWQAKKSGRSAAQSRQELALTDTRNQTSVSHRDIGVGVSQMLPILATACGSNNQIHAIEQPEIHVHPALQAELGDLFIESALGERKNTFLLETHSEHLILRILRRIRETSSGVKSKTPIRPEDVAVLYVQPSDKGSRVVELPITPDGDFATPWPGGFFVERFQELPL